VIQWELLIAAERKTRPRLAREHDPTGRHTRSFPSFLPSRREERRQTCVVVSNGEHGGRAEEAHRPVGRFDSNSTEPTHQKKRAIPCRPTPEAETATWIGWRGDSSGRNRRRQRVKSPSGERDAMQPASARLLASTSSPEKAAAAVGLWRAHCRCAAGRVVAGSLRPLFANPFSAPPMASARSRFRTPFARSRERSMAVSATCAVVQVQRLLCQKIFLSS
jgi:hypothetical protein